MGRSFRGGSRRLIARHGVDLRVSTVVSMSGFFSFFFLFLIYSRSMCLSLSIISVLYDACVLRASKDVETERLRMGTGSGRRELTHPELTFVPSCLWTLNRRLPLSPVDRGCSRALEDPYSPSQHDHRRHHGRLRCRPSESVAGTWPRRSSSPSRGRPGRGHPKGRDPSQELRPRRRVRRSTCEDRLS